MRKSHHARDNVYCVTNTGIYLIDKKTRAFKSEAIGRGGVGGHIASKCQTGISTQLSDSTAKRSSTASIFPRLDQTSETKGFPIGKLE